MPMTMPAALSCVVTSTSDAAGSRPPAGASEALGVSCGAKRLQLDAGVGQPVQRGGATSADRTAPRPASAALPPQSFPRSHEQAHHGSTASARPRRTSFAPCYSSGSTSRGARISRRRYPSRRLIKQPTRTAMGSQVRLVSTTTRQAVLSGGSMCGSTLARRARARGRVAL